MKRKITFTLAFCMLFATACTNSNSPSKKGDNVLRIASWDEYIDMGGEDSYYSADSKPIYEEFEAWYNEQHPDSPITVEYVALQDNETMYNKIKMGDEYDLLCPSEYMAMKLKAEDKLIPFDAEFFNPEIEGNYYAQNVSAYTQSIFEMTGLSEYIAGYMWGTTGFVYNPENIGNSVEEAREIMSSWHCLTNKACQRKITAKDNVRDSYFMGLGMYYEQELLNLDPNAENYAATLSQKMNDTSVETMSEVKSLLEKARRNLYGLETDEGKTDVAAGRLDASYQWSGDGVYILDMAEENDLFLEYSIPKSASNLWFDGWVMMKDANKQAATAFVNYISRPENIVRNMYYIGYTSCLAGEEVYQYIADTYGAEEDDETAVEYDLSYFFGDAFEPFIVPEEQTRRQLFAQYPDAVTKNRLVVMNYFNKEENERANRMWNNIK
ncbi:MAG: extracellular solute-binding protein [Clostridia bacterium]|nr:extracellular solute-binding protein [Clostridia bacterium]